MYELAHGLQDDSVAQQNLRFAESGFSGNDFHRRRDKISLMSTEMLLGTCFYKASYLGGL